MPVLTELSEDVRSGLLEKSATKTLDKSLFALFPKNIELWMTYLAQAHPWLSEAENLRNRAAFSDIVEEINRQLSFRIARTISERCPNWLTQLVTKWHKTQTPVLTLNYDTLVERCAGRNRDIYSVPLTPAFMRTTGIATDGRKQSFTLHKLHGSMNWFYSGASDPTGETIYYLQASRWENVPPSSLWEGTASDKVPFIVPPLSEKGIFFQHETVRSMWRQAGDALELADRVFILGYSLPQTDLTMQYFLTNKFRAGQQTFFLVNTDNTVSERFKKLFGDNLTFNLDFVGVPNPIPDFVERYVSGKL